MTILEKEKDIYKQRGLFMILTRKLDAEYIPNKSDMGAAFRIVRAFNTNGTFEVGTNDFDEA